MERAGATSSLCLLPSLQRALCKLFGASVRGSHKRRRRCHSQRVRYRFPQTHWQRLRTSNVIERVFREVRRRTDVVGRFPGETAALVLIWATLEEDRLVGRG